ncbi:MAG: hypothetical protein Ct9H300mP12_07210 [Acidimicrobiales bacterium]|nr:MAG: hypothetical protein Ct9H300mP12_07210 [Acidimicrobiales bacterium]
MGPILRPRVFDGSAGWTDDFVGEPMPDIEGTRNTTTSWVSTWSPGTPSCSRPGSSTGPPGTPEPNGGGPVHSMVGRDAIWHPHPGCDPTVTAADTTAVPGEYPADDHRFPVGWSIT